MATIFTNFLYQLLFTVGIVAAFGLLLVFSQRAFCALVGHKGYKILLVTGIVGTPIHELSHAITCVVFGHRINEIKLYQPNSEDGTLGYVNHSFNERSLYQQVGNFFIGIAPILFGSAALFGLMYLLIPEQFNALWTLLDGFTAISKFSFENFFELFKTVLKILFSVDNLSNILWWVFLLLALMVSSHMGLSGADIRGGVKGFLLLAFLLLVADAVLYFFFRPTLALVTATMTSFAAYISCFLVLAGAFSLVPLAVGIVLKIFGFGK